MFHLLGAVGTKASVHEGKGPLRRGVFRQWVGGEGCKAGGR